MIKHFSLIILIALIGCSKHDKKEIICFPPFIVQLFDLKVCINQSKQQVLEDVGKWGEDYDSVKTNRYSSKIYRECYLEYVFDFKKNKLIEIEVTSGTLWVPTKVDFHENRLKMIVATFNEYFKEKGLDYQFDIKDGSKSFIDGKIKYTISVHRFLFRTDKTENLIYSVKINLFNSNS